MVRSRAVVAEPREFGLACAAKLMGIIRLLLALAVLLAHVENAPAFLLRFIPGSLAVQCFYIISGFYMALVLNGKYSSKRDFYFNRFLRLSAWAH